MSSELALVFIMLVIYFIVSRWLPKMWKPTGKDCLPGTGETESYWQRVFFQCGFTAPRQFLSFPEVFRSFFFFFLRALFSLLISYFMSPGGSCRDNTVSSGRWHFGKDWERWSWFVQRDSNNNNIKSWIKHVHLVLCLDPKDLLTPFSHKSGCQDVSQTGWLWQALSITQGVQREMLIF